MRAWGPSTGHHSVRPCGPALLAVGVAGGGPRGGCLPLLRGASDVRRSPSPDCPPTGRSVGVHYPRAVVAGVWVWGPNTVPLACMPCGGCVPRGLAGGCPRGGSPAAVVRGVWCQALSLPLPPVLWGGRPRFRDPCVPGAVGAGVGTQHRFHSVRPCGPALLAVGVAGGGSPGGGAFQHCEGRLRLDAPPPPTAHLMGGLLGSVTHTLWARAYGCGGPSLPPWPACPVRAACRGGGGGPSPGAWPATVARGL